MAVNKGGTFLDNLLFVHRSYALQCILLLDN